MTKNKNAQCRSYLNVLRCNQSHIYYTHTLNTHIPHNQRYEEQTENAREIVLDPLAKRSNGPWGRLYLLT